ncbi:MAG: NUDIX hydrolase [Nanoarchaeota archaeon]
MKTIKQVKVLIRNKGKYLLLKKTRDIHPDHIGGWETPGGKIEVGENAEKAVLREVKEETKLNCKIIKELKHLKLEKDGVKTSTRVYLAEAKNRKVKLSDEHSDFRWVSYDEIDKLDNAIYKDLLKKYVREVEKISL